MWHRPGQLTREEIDALNGVRHAYTVLRRTGWLDGRAPGHRIESGWYDVLIYPFNRVYSGRYYGGRWTIRPDASGPIIEMTSGPDYYRPRELAVPTRRERMRGQAISDWLARKAGLTE